MTKDTKDSKDTQIVKEPEPEPVHGGDWFWGDNPPETPPVIDTKTTKTKE